MAKPRPEQVDWWDEASKKWRPVAETPRPERWSRFHVELAVKAKPRPPAAKSQVETPLDLRAFFRERMQANSRYLTE